jgi:RNA polymerase sigma-70 factor (ECF subfamily)
MTAALLRANRWIATIADDPRRLAGNMVLSPQDLAAVEEFCTIARVEQGLTTVCVQRYLNELAGVRGDVSAEPIVRDLLARSVERLHLICGRLLHQSYPRLTRGPVNLTSDELLSAVVERMIKAMRTVHPGTVRQFFALANQHMRWELNDMARRLDEKVRAIGLSDSVPHPQPPSDSSQAGPTLQRILQAIDGLPEDEREVFQLVRLQGMSKTEVAEVIGISAKTVHRRLNRGLLHLTGQLGDLGGQSTTRRSREVTEKDSTDDGQPQSSSTAGKPCGLGPESRGGLC